MTPVLAFCVAGRVARPEALRRVWLNLLRIRHAHRFDPGVPPDPFFLPRRAWPVPPVLSWLQRLGDIERAEMDRVFNMSIGMVLVASSFYAESIRHQLAQNGLESRPVGRVHEGPRGVVWSD